MILETRVLELHRGEIIFTTWLPCLESPRTRRVFWAAAFLSRNFFSVISSRLRVGIAAGAAGGKHVLALPISTRIAQLFATSAQRVRFAACSIDEIYANQFGSRSRGHLDNHS